MATSMPIELYTDGSCLRNPGPGGWAYIIKYWEVSDNPEDVPQVKEIEGSQGYRLTTNNRMEIMAAIFGLTKILELINSDLKGSNQINLMSDSEYLCKAINQRWIQKWSDNNWMTSGYKGAAPTPVKNKDLWMQVVDLQNRLNQYAIALTVKHVAGHNGVDGNEKCDKMAVAASNAGNTHIIDQPYEDTANVYNRR